MNKLEKELKQFIYGVSFNCNFKDETIGAGEERCISLDYVGDELDKIEAFLITECKDFSCTRDHSLIGKEVSDEGLIQGSSKVVSVLIEDGDEYYVIAVIFTNPKIPEVIERTT
jgi:hypothetical protein